MEQNLAQFTFDTLLIAGWREFWNYKRLYAACAERGLRLDAEVCPIDLRAFKHRFNGKIEIRTAVYETCKELSAHLRMCKTGKDFVKIRNLLNSGFYKFKPWKGYMINATDRRKHEIDKRNMVSDREMVQSIVSSSKKLGGCGGPKRFRE